MGSLVQVRSRVKHGKCAFFSASCFSLGLLLVIAGPIAAQPAVDTEAPEWQRLNEILERGRVLRLDEKYEEAVAAFREVAARPAYEPLCRVAFSEIVFTLLQAQDDTQARAVGRQALMEYPDLNPDTRRFPAHLRALFDELRESMFGSLVLETEPQNCRVTIGTVFEGESRVSIRYLLAGSYEVIVSRDGYHQSVGDIVIEPNQNTSEEIKLQRIGKYADRGGVLRLSIELGRSWGAIENIVKSGAVPPSSDFKPSGAGSLSLGAFADIALVRDLYFESGARFVRFSGDFDGDAFTLDYLFIPLSLKWFLFRSDFFAVGGFELGFDRGEFLQNPNRSWTFGGGYELGWRDHFIYLSVMASIGSKDILELSAGDGFQSETGRWTWRTRELRLSLGFVL